MELTFEVRAAEEGGFIARALGHSIFTEADSRENLTDYVREVTALHFEDEEIRPRALQINFFS